jgi:hypothetical protein
MPSFLDSFGVSFLMAFFILNYSLSSFF